ncbi:hypothetical protein GH714_034231 [Hevea brasiliensis]|uniref:DOG1 domain-containing protein n=1 Tax=Hevea brasiliensis TaxID=3981 RepID=A0A6A6NCR6_HEVBR|nr:hypothetical protein GH714_034231 [Hevea brasiliensis]
MGGCLAVGFPRRLVFGDESNSFLADPAEVEQVSFDTCPVHVEVFHWAARPLAIALGVSTAMKLTISVGRRVSTKLRKGRRSGDGHYQDGSGGGNAAWFPPPFASTLFKEGAPIAIVRTICEKNGYEQENVETEDVDNETDGMAHKVEAFFGKVWSVETRTKLEHKAAETTQGKGEFEQLIDEQLNRFHPNYNRAMIPTRLKDVAQFLMPKWAPPNELAALAWLGEWRPSAILDLLQGLVHFPSSSLKDSNDMERLLSQVISEIRVEEVIIDEEMAEIQATCIFHLPFASFNKYPSRTTRLACIQAEFKKIEKVITKAQQLRSTFFPFRTKLNDYLNAALMTFKYLF